MIRQVCLPQAVKQNKICKATVRQQVGNYSITHYLHTASCTIKYFSNILVVRLLFVQSRYQLSYQLLVGGWGESLCLWENTKKVYTQRGELPTVGDYEEGLNTVTVFGKGFVRGTGEEQFSSESAGRSNEHSERERGCE